MNNFQRNDIRDSLTFQTMVDMVRSKFSHRYMDSWVHQFYQSSQWFRCKFLHHLLNWKVPEKLQWFIDFSKIYRLALTLDNDGTYIHLVHHSFQWEKLSDNLFFRHKIRIWICIVHFHISFHPVHIFLSIHIIWFLHHFRRDNQIFYHKYEIREYIRPMDIYNHHNLAVT